LNVVGVENYDIFRLMAGDNVHLFCRTRIPYNDSLKACELHDLLCMKIMLHIVHWVRHIRCSSYFACWLYSSSLACLLSVHDISIILISTTATAADWWWFG
jgi:hypothetical protein